jgi:hypothetical protein
MKEVNQLLQSNEASCLNSYELKFVESILASVYAGVLSETQAIIEVTSVLSKYANKEIEKPWWCGTC